VWAKGSGLLPDSNWRIERAALAGPQTRLENAALRANRAFFALVESATGFGGHGAAIPCRLKTGTSTIRLFQQLSRPVSLPPGSQQYVPPATLW
jgi:hypothetical protein